MPAAHMLVEVEPKPENADQMSDAELVARVRKGHGKTVARTLEIELADMLCDGRTLMHAATRAILAIHWKVTTTVFQPTRYTSETSASSNMTR